MAGEWREIPFGEAAETLPGRYLPAAEYDPGGSYLIYGSNSIMGKAREPLYEGPLVAFARIGSNCGATRFSKHACWINNNAAAIRGRAGVDTRFLYYWMQSFDFAQIREGSGQPYISNRTLDAQLVPYPPLPEQRAIASILGAIDDKIDLNRRMSETLEAMARALFKSWFVDFDPVRAKAEGRDPGLPKEIADLFPDRLVDSELGEIPEGWKVVDTAVIATVCYGAPYSSARFNADGLGTPLIRIRDLETQSPKVSTDEVHPKGRLVRPGDIVVGMDGAFRAHLWSGPEALLNQRVCLFDPRDEFGGAFVRCAIERPLRFVEATESATTVIHLGKGDIDGFRFVRAQAELHARFKLVADLWHGRAVRACREAAALSTLRDTLLPKLISGELRIPDPERFLKEVAA